MKASRSTLICKQSFAMASNRSRRLNADQARELFRNLHDEESENSLDESDRIKYAHIITSISVIGP